MIDKIFANKDYRQLFFFLIIGSSGALAYVLLNTWALSVFKYEKHIISTSVYACLILPIYLLQRRFSFESTESVAKTLPKYIFTHIIGMLLTYFISDVVFTTLGLPDFWGSIASICATSALSFVLLKVWAFKKA